MAQGVPLKIYKSTSRSFTPSTLRLFNALPIDSPKQTKKPDKLLLQKTINNGFMFSPEVVGNYSEEELSDLIQVVSEEIGLSPEAMNSSFHKSWVKVRDTPIFQLVVEQIVHYITTYGFEYFGIYDSGSVYIPNEKLKIPALEEDIRLTVIRGYTKLQLKDKLLNLLKTGIALKEQTINDVVGIAVFCGFDDLEQVRNKEVRTILYDKLDVLPVSPEAFLSLMVYKKTDKSLLIKNKETIDAIKTSEENTKKFYEKYNKQYGLERLAEIFFRFKPIFLAFKKEEAMIPIINKIRKLADKYHKAMQPNFLNGVTAMLSRGETIKISELEDVLGEVNTFRKIRLLYALNYRLSKPTSILYKIRNGKGYSTSFSFTNTQQTKKIYDVVLDSIINNLKKNVKGREIYIPNNIKYALPATEKQFTGNIPSGSYISIPRDMIVGVYWENVEGNRIDLDLSLISIKNGKIGWDAKYRDSGVLFSGDMTDATNGASELFYLAKTDDNAYIMFVNYYNHDEDINVPFKVLVAKELVKDFKQNYMVNPNNVLCVAKTNINVKQKILGLVITTSNECRFYFSETGMGNSITSSDRDYTIHARNYLINFFTKPISLNEVLSKSGAIMVNEKGKDIIDLSPETLEKNTIINLIK